MSRLKFRIGAAGLGLSLGLALAAGQTWAAEDQIQPFAPAFFAQFQVSTALDMIWNLPGFSFYGGDGSRGFSGAAGNVLINGRRPASKTDSLSDVLSRIPADSVERIDLISGGAEGVDMQGQPKIANVILKQADSNAASVSLWGVALAKLQAKPGGELNLTHVHGDQRLNLYVSDETDPDTGQGKGVRDTATPGAGVDHQRVFADAVSDRQVYKVNYSQDLIGGRISINATASPNAYHYDGRYIDSITERVDNVSKEDKFELGGQFTKTLAAGLELDSAAIYRRSNVFSSSDYSDPSTTSEYLESDLVEEKIVTGQVNWSLSQALSLRAGIEGAINSRNSAVASFDDGVSQVLPSANVYVEEDRTEAQVSSTWTAIPKVTLEAGVKVESSTLSQQSETPETKSFVYPKPRVLVSWAPYSDLNLHLRVERQVGQLNFGDFVSSVALLDGQVTAGNPNLAPSTTWVSEAGLDYQFWRKGALTLTLEHDDISDVIDRIPIFAQGTVYDAAGNIGEASSDSLTSAVSVPTDLWLDHGLFKLRATWATSRVVDPTTLEPRRLSGQQPFYARLEFSQDLPQTKLAWGFSADTGWSNTTWRVSETDQSHGDGWVMVYAEYRPAAKLKLRVECSNVDSRSSTYDRVVYNGLRSAGSVDYTEHNQMATQPYLYFRVRQEL